MTDNGTAQRLYAEGAPFKLADGREVRARFDMRTLMLVEEQFGSTVAMAQRLNDPQEKKYTWFTKALACALHHEDGIDEDTLVDLLDPRDMKTYDEALTSAWEQAFPEPKAGADPNLNGEKNSPGSSTTTPPQSASPVQTVSSGA